MKLHEGEVAKYRARTRRSQELLDRCKQVIPTGHGGGMGYQLPYPVLLNRGQGCWVWDVDDNQYLDLRIGDWVMILGHGDERITAAVTEQMRRGMQFGCPEWDLGYRMARLLIDRMPSVEKVRFFASGTETNEFAIRLSRAFTGRQKIVKSTGSYHGVGANLLIGTSIIRDGDQKTPNGMLPGSVQDLIEIPYNDPDGAEAIIERHQKDIAALLIEPVMGAAGMIEASTAYLRRLREVTAKYKIILIFDEVVTFPVAYGGAQAHHNVKPDLTTMSKAIGGGVPMAAIGGRADIMELCEVGPNGVAPVAAASTFGGNLVAMAAGIACLEALTPEKHDHINAMGKRAMAGIDELGRRYNIPLHSTGLGHLFGMHWAPERVVDYRTRLLDDREKLVNINLALMNQGIYQMFFGTFLLSSAIGTQEIDTFLQAMEQSLHTLGLVS